MRLPFTLGVNRPSYRWSFIIVTQPVPLFRILGSYDSKNVSVAFSLLTAMQILRTPFVTVAALLRLYLVNLNQIGIAGMSCGISAGDNDTILFRQSKFL